MPTVPTPPPSYTTDDSSQRREESETASLSSASDKSSIVDDDDDERSNSSHESIEDEDGVLRIEKGTPIMRAINLARGAKDNGFTKIIVPEGDKILGRAVFVDLEADGGGLEVEGYNPTPKNQEKDQKLIKAKINRRNTNLPNYDKSLNSEELNGLKAEMKMVGSALLLPLDPTLGYASYKLFRSGLNELDKPTEQDFSAEIISDAMRGKASRGETEVTLTGQEPHADMVWFYASLEGLNVHGYTPTDKGITALSRALGERERSLPSMHMEDPKIPHKPNVFGTLPEAPGRPDVKKDEWYEYDGDSQKLKDLCDQTNDDLEDILNRDHPSEEEFIQALDTLDNKFVEDFGHIAKQEQRYQYDGPSNELKEVCAKANEEIDRILDNSEGQPDDEIDTALEHVHKQFNKDFTRAAATENNRTLQKRHESYLKEHAPQQLEELQRQHTVQKEDLEKTLKEQGKSEEERQPELDKLEFKQLNEIGELYDDRLSQEQNDINLNKDIKWGRGFDKSIFGTALVDSGLKFESGGFFGKGGGFYRPNADDGDKKKRKPAVKLKRDGRLKFKEKPPHQDTVDAVAKAAIANGADSILLKGSEEYKRMMWKACMLEAARKGVPFTVKGYNPSPKEKEALDLEIAKERRELFDKIHNKENLSIKTVEDKKETAKPPVEIESIEPPGPEELSEPERPAPRAPRVVRGGAGGPGPAVPRAQRPTIDIPPSISSRSPSSPSLDTPSLSPSLSSASSSPTLETPLDREPLDVRRRDYRLSDDDQSPSQEKFKRAVSIEQTEPQRTIIRTDSGLPEFPASPTLSETAGDLDIDGKKTRSQKAAVSRENSREDSIQTSVADDHTKKALLSQNLISARANVSDASIDSSPASPTRESTIKLPSRVVTPSPDKDNYFVRVVDVRPEGAIVEHITAHTNEGNEHSKQFLVTPDMGGCGMKIGEIRRRFSVSEGLGRSQTQNQGQGQKLKRKGSFGSGGGG